MRGRRDPSLDILEVQVLGEVLLMTRLEVESIRLPVKVIGLYAEGVRTSHRGLRVVRSPDAKDPPDPKAEGI